MRDLKASCAMTEFATVQEVAALQFPVYERDWSMEEELKLLDGVEKYGWGNWKCVLRAGRGEAWRATPKRALLQGDCGAGGQQD